MVVLSVAILSKSNPLLARQFVEMTKIRVQSLLSAFPKLLDKRATDHTFIDHDNVRYIYQPMEALYILLITNKHSNILEDLETLRLLAQIVQEICQDMVNEELILKKAFDLIFAFDEVISFGYKDLVTINQIKTYTQMDSNEENFHNIVQKNKEREEIERRDEFSKKFEKEKHRQKKEEREKLDRAKGAPPPPPPDYSLIEFTPEPVPPRRQKGMVLDSMKNKEKFIEAPPAVPKKESFSTIPVTQSTPKTPLTLNLIEKFVGRIHFEGSLDNLSAEGYLEAIINNPTEAGFAFFKVSKKDEKFKFSVHPSLDKAQFKENKLKLKDDSEAYPSNITLVRWRLLSPSEEYVPFDISCWPSEIPGGTNVSIEIELNDINFPLQDIHIQLMCPSGCNLEVSKVTAGSFEQDEVTLHWIIPELNEGNYNALLEFSYNLILSSEFQFTVEAIGKNPVSKLNVLECLNMKNDKKIETELVQKIYYSFVIVQ